MPRDQHQHEHEHEHDRDRRCSAPLLAWLVCVAALYLAFAALVVSLALKP
jgi:hypothetical protein